MAQKYIKKILLLGFFAGFGSHNLMSVPASAMRTPMASSPVMDLGAVTGDGSSKYRTYFTPTNEVLLPNTNSKLLFGAMINADYYFLRRAETLDQNIKEDARSQFRQRTEFTCLFKYDIKPETNRSAVDVRITLGNTLFWRSLLNPRDYHNDQVIKGSLFDYNWSPLHTQFQEAWFQVNIDRLAKKIENRKHCLKIGYFPFLVGRGISLGDWTLGGVDYMGFNKSGIQTYAPMYPPGILWHGEVSNYSGYDIYFSPLPTEDIVAANYGNYVQTKMPTDDPLLSRHIFAASIKLGGDFKDLAKKISLKNGSGMINPYWVYYNSPRQSIDRGADSPTHLHTFGCMTEISAGGFELNFEFAKQIGRQTVRERIYTEYPSIHHFDPATGAFRALPASVHNTTGFATNPNSRFVGDNTPAGVYWQDQDQLKRLAEHHPQYEIDLSGIMAVMDARYAIKDSSVIVAGAFGYFSGDAYPYNDNVDNFLALDGSDYHTVDASGVATIKPEAKHKYDGFLPLRDREYAGLWVHPLVLVNAGIVPRPKNMDLFDLSARNDTDTLTNLVYVGGGVAVRPLEDSEKLRINANVLSYWIDERLKKWDSKALPPAKLKNTEGVYAGGRSSYDDLNIKGWESTETAHKHLGWEVNGIVSYKVTKNLDFSLRGGVFFPGQLYSDIANQPNVATLVDEKLLDDKVPGKLNAKTVYRGLGQDITFGCYLRLRYVF